MISAKLMGGAIKLMDNAYMRVPLSVRLRYVSLEFVILMLAVVCGPLYLMAFPVIMEFLVLLIVV
jgi:hypothetical protein